MLKITGRCAVAAAMMAIFMGTAVFAQSQENRVPGGQKYVTVMGIPSATVAPHGLVFLQGINKTNLGGTASSDSHGLSFGFGLGSAEDNVGFQISGSYNSASGGFDDFALFGIKASRRVSLGNAPSYLAVSLDRLAGTGAASGVDPSASIVLSRFYNLTNASTSENYPLMTSVGVGTHVRNQSQDPGLFFGAGVGLTEEFGLSASWNGDFVDVGTAFRFDLLENVGFSVALSDAFNMDDRQQIMFGATWFFDTAER